MIPALCAAQMSDMRAVGHLALVETTEKLSPPCQKLLRMGTQHYAADGRFYDGFNVDSLAPSVPVPPTHTHTRAYTHT